MKDTTLTKISFLLAIIGLITLYFTTKTLPEATLTTLNTQEKTFTTQATILTSNTHKNKTYLTLSLCENITGTINKNTSISPGTAYIEGEFYTWKKKKYIEIIKLEKK
ncbi:hypothetical protein CMO92_04885 [Candidatus Woesearchaeota archaeon]|nr:hypothetical protein [Candidatus Woesearchaeota archaeon]|tara:strand:- start:799 stop:1122 length:324 start_codon:yes stop_codon:yes gene_type:complete